MKLIYLLMLPTPSIYLKYQIINGFFFHFFFLCDISREDLSILKSERKQRNTGVGDLGLLPEFRLFCFYFSGFRTLHFLQAVVV